VEAELYAFLRSGLDGHFIPGEKAPGIHWIGGWVDSRAFLDPEAKRKIPSLPLPGIKPWSSSL